MTESKTWLMKSIIMNSDEQNKIKIIIIIICVSILCSRPN